MRLEFGFTLLEILVALVITVVGISAIVKTAGGAVDILQTTEDRVLGSWVASNRLAELRLSRRWPGVATRDLSEKLGGRDWFYREAISTTSDPDLLRVDLAVYTDKDHELQSAELFGYVARYVPPSEAPPVIPGPTEELEQERGGAQQLNPAPVSDDTEATGNSQSQGDSGSKL